METMTFDLATRHAGRMLDEHNGELWDIAAKCIQHYIFTWGDQKIREGTCTACGETMELWHEYKSVPGWVLHDPYVDTVDTSDDAFNATIKGTTNHLDYGYCPRCGAKIQFRGLARGRQTLIEKLFLVRYGKSVIDSNTVACVGYDVRVRWGRMDDTENVLEPPIDIYPMELCVFRYGVDATRYVRERFWVMRDDNRLEKLADLRFTEKRTCTSGYFSDGQFIDYSGMRTVLDGESFDTAIADTPFARVFSYPQILDAHEFDRTDRITPMARIAKYPCIEYLLKMDMDSLARDVIDKTHLGTLNIRGKKRAEGTSPYCRSMGRGQGE